MENNQIKTTDHEHMTSSINFRPLSWKGLSTYLLIDIENSRYTYTIVYLPSYLLDQKKYLELQVLSHKSLADDAVMAAARRASQSLHS